MGDVHDGVAAWTGSRGSGASSTAASAEPVTGPPVDPVTGAVAGPPADPIAEGPEADQEAVARKILLDQLTGRARSRRELADRLARRQVPEELATRLLDRFEEVGLVDDAAFARSWIASRGGGGGGGKGLARRALAQELRRKGVGDEVVRAALDEIDPDDEEEAARRLVRKKLRSLRGVDQATATRRLAGMLARKGYPPGVAFAVVRDELGEAEEAGEHLSED